MTDAPSLSPNAMTVLRKRYLRKDRDGTLLEDPEGMFRRVARNVAAVDYLYGDRNAEEDEEEFYQAMRHLQFLPNSPTLMNAGTPIQQLAACFVIPVEDSIEAIFDAVKWAAIVHQSGGGTGFSFSRLRPQGDLIESTSGEASGPISFMKVFDLATETVKQGGRRRGASMGTLRVDHPDIRSFIQLKADKHTLSNFNISVALTDQFMQALADGDYLDLVNPHTGEVQGRIAAPLIFEELVQTAWATGDPGVLFLDEVNRHNPTPQLGQMECTNPCGEVPLLPFEACNLGSINLTRMVRWGEGWKLDEEGLRGMVDLGVRFLDNVIDASKYPLAQIEHMARGNRKIGLGVMGFADLLLMLGIRYGSDESEAMARHIMGIVRDQAERTSERIARSRGSFPNREGSIFAGPRRNATLLSIAPTGTISIIAGCSSGIEPNYAYHFQRHVLDGEDLNETNPLFLRALEENDIDPSSVLSGLEGMTSLQTLTELPQSLRRVFVTAHDIPPREQVHLQAAFQDFVDNAVSKTINLPPDATVDDVQAVIEQAYHAHCKGITVYREGSKPGQVMTAPKKVECQMCGRLS